ncbi:Mce protein [Mycobacterium sp.]|uniref:Mce protein n=1 Tax=Mycobacterium sp. TaxID=1785 RepID=UPI003C78F14C
MAKHADTPDGELSGSTRPPPNTTAEDLPASIDDQDSEAVESQDPASDIEVPSTQATTVDDTEGVDHTDEPGEAAAAKRPRSGVRLALALGIVVILALGAIAGWLGYRGYREHQAMQQRELFLRVGRQGALNLTTISYTEVDVDVQRILDSATGSFYDDFRKRSQPFIDVVKQAQSKSVGTITAAGLESIDGDRAQVLVAVHVTTSNVGAAEQPPRAWRMRVDVQKVGDGAKVSNVDFVP